MLRTPNALRPTSPDHELIIVRERIKMTIRLNIMLMQTAIFSRPQSIQIDKPKKGPNVYLH